MIMLYRLDLRTAPAGRPVDQSSLFTVHIYIGSHVLCSTSSGYQRAWLDVNMFQYFIINRVFKY